MTDLKKRLEKRKRESEWAETWRPDPGEVLVGTFEKMDTGETEYGASEIAHIRDEDGELWGVWLFHTVLQERWTESDPEPGDEVGIVYLGERDGDPHTYHAYDVEVERQDETPESEEPPAPDFAENGESTIDDPNGELPY